jgi:hypothetical protein
VPNANHAASIDFLDWLRPGGPWLLVAIDPDNLKIEGRTFEHRGDVLAWLTTHDNRNIYYSVNPTREPMSKKPKKDDIAHAEFLHIDIDQRNGEDFDAEMVRAKRVLSEVEPRPSAMIFSGGGYQGLWRLTDPEDDAAVVEACNRFFVDTLKGDDHCFNIDRVFRLPGTINWPNDKKRRRGRRPDLAIAVELNDNIFPIGAFSQQEKKTTTQVDQVKIPLEVERVELADLPCTHGTKVIITNGFDPDNPKRFAGDRSSALWHVACMMVKEGCTDPQIYAVITDERYRISEHVLDQKRDIRGYAMRQIARARDNAFRPELAEMNADHAIVQDVGGGKCRVISSSWDHALKRQKWVVRSFQDFRDAYLRKKITITSGQRQKIESIGYWWLECPYARSYSSMVFLPGRDVPPNTLNLWTGFAVPAEEGDCSLFLDHARENVCGGNEEYYNYLMAWFATMFQKPAEPGHVAVVLRGEMGTGKGFLARHVGHLLGRHFVHVTQSKHLTGNFNIHLRDALLVFSDEATYAGDKAHASTLKAIITEDTLMVEPKGIDTTPVSNFIHLMMAGNENWLVPAGPMERRFFVLDVGQDHMQDHAYFNAIAHQLENGGYEALLHLFLHWDLTGFNVRQMPKTRALAAQKLYSMSPEEEWWFNKLRDGCVFVEHDGWQRNVLAAEVLNDYIEQLRWFSRSRTSNSTRLGMFLRKALPSLGREQLMEARAVEIDGRVRQIRRPWEYTLPSLDECRHHWDRHFGGPHQWESNNGTT